MTQQVERTDARTNRARILSAAVALFAERGVDAEVRDIAERAGVAVGTLYNHFPRKDHLLVAVLREALREFQQATEQALIEPDVIVALRSFVHDGLAVAERYGALMAAIAEGRLLVERNDAEEAQATRVAINERLVAMVRRGIDAHVFRPELDVEVAISMLSSVFLPWTLTDLRLTRTPDQIAAALLAVFFDGARRR